MIKRKNEIYNAEVYSSTRHTPLAVYRRYSSKTKFSQIVLYQREFGSLYLTIERGDVSISPYLDENGDDIVITDIYLQKVLSYSWWDEAEYNLAIALIPENFEDYRPSLIAELLDTFIVSSLETEKPENYQVRLYQFNKAGFQVSIFRNWVNEYSQADVHITNIDLYTLIANNWVCVGMPSIGCSHYKLYSHFGSK